MRYRSVLTGALLIVMSLTSNCQDKTSRSRAVTVTVDATQRHQTWEGWEVTAEHFHFDALTLGDRHPVP